MNKALYKPILAHAAAILGLLILSCIFFYPQIEGKVLQPGDLVSWQGMSQEVNKIAQETGEEPLWTNSMFGGMPTYQINTRQPGNVLSWIEKASRLFIHRPIGTFFALMLGFYILLSLLGISPWLSLLGATAFGFTSSQLILLEAGHVSKLRVIAFLGLTVAGVVFAYKKKFVAGAMLFAVGLGLQLFGNHVQMTYYFFLCLVVYGIVQLTRAIRKKEVAVFLKATGALVIGGLLAIASSTSLLWTTYEYSADTMRGNPILTMTSDVPQSSSETSGLEWGYAMRWSNGLIDVFTILIPGVAGGGAQEPIGTNSSTYRDLRQKGAQLPEDFKVPLYWGALPFTSGPVYFGAGIIFLFILGLFIVKGPMKWWLSIAALFTILLSMGSHFAILNEPMFNYFPLYNKFRAPSSILAVTSFLIPILALLALTKVMRREVSKDELLKAVKIAGGITGGVCLLFVLVGPSLFSFSGQSDAQIVQSGFSLDTIINDRKALMRRDAIRSLLIILVFAGLVWFYVKEKIGMLVVTAGLVLTTIVDLWGVGRRYLDASAFQEKARAANTYEPRPVDQQIMSLEPHRGAYRVLDLSVNTFNSAWPSYYHNTIGGYHAAKLQRYQDIIDRHISRNNIAVLNMLNCKYIISTDEQLRVNEGALGNAWFVDEVTIVESANAEIDALSDFDPAVRAYVHRDFAPQVSNPDPDKNGTISLTSYSPDHLQYSSSTTSDQLAVFSEIWYGPDKGWVAYVDGVPVDHMRANYVLRALSVPAGEHTIEFRFRPRSYYQGKSISLAASLCILLALFGYIGRWFYEMSSTSSLAKPKSIKARGSSSRGRSKKRN